MKKWLLIGMVSVSLSCSDEQALEQEWVQTTVEERLQDFREKKKKECAEQLMQRVLKSADSILIIESRFDIPDSIKVPEKKLKPTSPEIKFPSFKKPKGVDKDTSSTSSDQ